MTIIRDIYDKIGVVLREMRPTVGHRTFDTRAVYELYAKRYPGDVRFMKERQRKHPRAHSLEGYLNGMVSEYAQQADGSDRDMPAIEFVAEVTYRFTIRE